MNKQTRTNLREYCSFRIGGVTDNFLLPRTFSELKSALRGCKENQLTPIIFGYGANILFPDVPKPHYCFISLRNINQLPKEEKEAVNTILPAGLPVSFLSLFGKMAGVDYDFTYLLPGSIAGAVYMNARYTICEESELMNYPHEMSQIIDKVYILDTESLAEKVIDIKECDFGYKSSIFQQKNWIITAVELNKSLNLPEIPSASTNVSDLNLFYPYFTKLLSGYNGNLNRISEHRNKYHHFDLPSAGSVFKNNRELGFSIGHIIDEMGLKGLERNDAMISPHHGNIIVNKGSAKAEDVVYLIDTVTEKIYNKYGIKPEPEIKIIK